MTRDDINRMAGEVGIEFDPRWGTCYTGNTQLERFAALVAAAEREACARVCERFLLRTDGETYTPRHMTEGCAAAIRARSKA